MSPAWILVMALAAVSLAAVLLAWMALAASRRDRAALQQARTTDPGLGLLQKEMEGLRSTVQEGLATGQSRLDARFDALSTSVGNRIEASRRTLDARLEATNKVVQDVHRGLGEVDASVKGVSEITRDIKALQDILKAPKLRGGLGEFFLGDLLAQILPPAHYNLQHTFAGGERVDAVIRAGDSLVPVDAKFPLENFRRLLEATTDEERRRQRRAFVTDIRRHVEAIASRYIRPDEGTFPFALMYIPAENVYYEAVLSEEDLARDKSVLSYALDRRVIPVSPNSFYAYLQVILIGLQGLRIESQAQQILARLQSLRTDFGRFAEDYRLVGNHISRAMGRYDDSAKRLGRFQDRLEDVVEAEGGKLPATGKDTPRRPPGPRLPLDLTPSTDTADTAREDDSHTPPPGLPTS